MRKVFLIGGGELSQGETLPFDKIIVLKINKVKPKVLFVPTASHDSKEYIEHFTKIYSDLGCEVSCLLLCSIDNNPYLVKAKLQNIDLVYIGGGNTSFMMKKFYRCKFDFALKEAYQNGTMVAGLSAGGIAICENGYSDSNILEGGEGYSFVKGIGLIPFDHNPHADIEERKDFENDYATRKGVAISMENLTLLELDDEIIKDSYSLVNRKIEVISSSGKEILKKEIIQSKVIL